MENLQPGFGIRLKMLRLDNGLSQADFAELCGLSVEQVGKIETGKSWTGKGSFAVFAAVLDVDPIALLDFSRNEQFILEGGDRRRVRSNPGKLIVIRNKLVLLNLPKKRE